jgi:hypothetical protein
MSQPAEQPGRNDCFAPPPEPCECYCLHCQRLFMSDQIWFQRIVGSRDGFDGFWMCPTPNCDGAGFTFDIFPTDPNHPANAGWTDDDGDEEYDQEEQEDDQEPWDPAESHYSAMDEEFEEDDDIEGEEWKHGLAPGSTPPESPEMAQARRHWEEEQKKYDGPAMTFGEDDIPY